MKYLFAFWLPFIGDDFVDQGNVKNNDTALGRALSFFDITSEISDLSVKLYLSGVILNFYAQPSDVDISGKIKRGALENNINYIECKFCYKKELICLFVDAFGFYFIESDDESVINEFMDFVVAKSPLLFLDHQIELLADTILNERFKAASFDDNIEGNRVNEAVFAFLKYIMVGVDDIDPHLQEVSASAYISKRYGSVGLANGFGGRDYNIGYVKEKTRDLSKSELIALSIQDRIERISIEKFLKNASSRRYFEAVISNIKAVREGLVAKVVFLTSNDQDILSWLPRESIFIYENWTEEKIERYVEFIVSRHPSFGAVDKLLRTSYYHQVGNVSNISDVNPREKIDRLAAYQYWENNLISLDLNIKSLLDILRLYNDKKRFGELEDIKRQQANENDLSDIETQLGESTQETFGKADKEILSIFAVIIGAISLLGTIAQFFRDKIGDMIFIFGVFLVIFLSKRFASRLRNVVPWIIADLESHKLIGDVNFFQYRSRHRIKLADKYEKGIPHLNGDNFVEHIQQLELAKMKSYSDDRFLVPRLLLNYAHSKYEISRQDPHKRQVELKYVIKDYELYSKIVNNFLFMTANIDDVGLRLGKLSIIAIYNFGLRDEGKLQGGESSDTRYFQVYKDGVRLYFRLMLPKTIPQKLVRDLNQYVAKVLYCISIAHLHSELNDLKDRFTSKKYAECKGILDILRYTHGN